MTIKPAPQKILHKKSYYTQRRRKHSLNHKSTENIDFRRGIDEQEA